MNSDRVKVDNAALVKFDYMLETLEYLRGNPTSVAVRVAARQSAGKTIN